MEDLVVKPAAWRTALIAVLCVVFIVIGVLLVINGQWFDKILGAVSVVAFGVGGGYYLLGLSKGAPTFTLSTRGIDVGTGGHLPWSNIGKVGTTKALGGAPALGIQVRTPSTYAGSLSPEQQTAALRAAKTRLGVSRPSEASHNRTADLVAALNQMAKKTGGYHLAFPMLGLSGSAESMVATVEKYRTASKKR